MNRLLLTSAVLAAAALAAPAQSASTQDRGTELSFGMIGWSNTSCSGCNSVTSVASGGSFVSLGFFFNPVLALEPSASIAYLSSGGSHSTNWGLGLGMPVYFSPTWGHKGWFVEPGVMYQSQSCNGCATEHQTSLDAALGYKAPIAHDASLRLAGFYAYGFKTNDIPQTNSFGLQFGLSAFVR